MYTLMSSCYSKKWFSLIKLVYYYFDAIQQFLVVRTTASNRQGIGDVEIIIEIFEMRSVITW